MRSFLVLIVIGALGALYVWQKKSEAPPAVPTAQTTHAVTAQPPVSATPAAREVSEHNWMKRSLDRARDVTQQARAKTKESQDP